jgi:hypothetical protein
MQFIEESHFEDFLTAKLDIPMRKTVQMAESMCKKQELICKK